ncbi:PAB-dependent poly [Spathaspora sp. JA1]|nr:PAB-dependent poly [Spathaspora sp. JA1]
MDGWNEIVQIPTARPPPAWQPPTGAVRPHDVTPAITSLRFDTTQNLIWYGDSFGYTKSFSSSQANTTLNPYQQSIQLFPYTKFRTSGLSGVDSPVFGLLPHKDGILSLSKNQIAFNNRRGIPKLNVSASSFHDDLFNDLNSMTFNCNSLNDVVVGSKLSLMKFDLHKPTALTSFNHEGNVSLVKNSSKLLNIAKGNGSLELFDPVSNTSIKTFNSHNGFISDMDVRGNYIATCGYSLRPKRFHHHGHPQSRDFVVDPLVNIYDTRIMRAISPIPFPAGATSVRFHPKLPNIVIVSSSSGQIQFIDMFDQTNVYLYQADLSPQPNQIPSGPDGGNPLLSNLEISDNGDFLLFNDNYSNLHLWSITTGVTSKDFVSFPSPIEEPDIQDPTQDVNHIGIDDNVPLSCIGMPYYKDLLLSNYASDLKFVKELARVPERINPDLLVEAERNGGRFMHYDKTKYGPGNIVKRFDTVVGKTTIKNKSQIPKFISERTVNGSTSAPTEKNGADEVQAPITEAVDDSIFQYKNSNLSSVPNCYSRLQIQYSKFGVRDFDFEFYNKTNGLYCGLENHTDNSYINSLLQLYRFSPSFYNKITKNLLNEWLPCDLDTIMVNPEGSSILTELGYLFDMMDKAKGNNVKIYNFGQVLSHNKDAIAHHLVNLDEMTRLNSQDVRSLIISFNKFLLNQVNADLAVQSKDLIEDMMKLTYMVEVRGNENTCPIYDKKYGSMLSLDLVTPPNNMLNKMSILINPNLNATTSQQPPQLANIRRNVNILTYLEYSMNQVRSVPCQQHQHAYPHTLEIRTVISSLPPVLVLNVNLSNEEFKLINGFRKWLIPEFYAVNQKDKFSFKSMISPFDKANSAKYELLGFVCEISHSSDVTLGVHGLVTFVKLDQWYLFNDFLVMPIPEEEVLNLSYPWKRPVIIMYQEASIAHSPFEYFNIETFGKLSNLNDSIIYRDHFAGTIREGHKKEFELLTRQEAPGVDTLVAIDAEFVLLNPEQIEVHYDGFKKLIKPKILSLARVSVLRGDQETAFIDDYVVHTAEIHDYLTNFSGIEESDLDPIKSSKNLVTLQTAYRKLWLLLNLGVVFVGHGLYNDFRCINLQVPKNQIRDTAEFFYKSDFKRQLGLKFLAYVLLKEKVQSNNHDSIEDAYTALKLYKKYLELTSQGSFESTLNFIYSEGQQLRFRVPEDN